MPMWMPMDTHGRDLGYSVKLEIPLSERHTFELGNEFQRLRSMIPGLRFRHGALYGAQHVRQYK